MQVIVVIRQIQRTNLSLAIQNLIDRQAPLLHQQAQISSKIVRFAQF